MKLECPKCGSELSFNGYRPLFPYCSECDKRFHIDDCEKKEV